MPSANTKTNQKYVVATESSAERVPEFVLRTSKEFVAGYQPGDGAGLVFCPTRKKVPVGSFVAVKVRLGRRQPALRLFGQVAWRRPGRHVEKIRAGIGVELADAERAKCQYLQQLARAGMGARSRRRHERIPVDLPVSWRPLGVTDGANARIRDIGRGGAFVRTPRPATNDSQVVLEIAPPGAQVAMAFTARVAWTARSGDDSGFGIEWRARDAGGSRRIKELVRRLTATDHIPLG